MEGVGGQVLIAGAGPVGMTMAMALRRRGVGVRIIDRTAARTDKSKALVIWPRTLELLDIQGCVRPFLAAGLRGAARTSTPTVASWCTCGWTPRAACIHYALMIPQSETERVLEEELARPRSPRRAAASS